MLFVFSLIYLTALISVSLLAIALWLKVGLILIIIVLGVNSIGQYALLNKNNSVSRIIGFENGNCKIELKKGYSSRAKIVSVGSLFDYFIVIVIKYNSKNITSIIAKDSISQDKFHTLRLYLRSLKK